MLKSSEGWFLDLFKSFTVKDVAQNDTKAFGNTFVIVKALMQRLQGVTVKVIIWIRAFSRRGGTFHQTEAQIKSYTFPMEDGGKGSG